MFIDRKLIRSEAWLSLGRTAMQSYLLFRDKAQMVELKTKRGEKKRFKITNNGEIVFTYAQALRDFGISYERFALALSQLVKAGLIDISHHGGGLKGDCTLYSISDRWRRFGTDAFRAETRPKGRAPARPWPTKSKTDATGETPRAPLGETPVAGGL